MSLSLNLPYAAGLYEWKDLYHIYMGVKRVFGVQCIFHHYRK